MHDGLMYTIMRLKKYMFSFKYMIFSNHNFLVFLIDHSYFKLVKKY